ncbi:hypothetical protein GCM10008983_09500 [Lentibacillus halophilus]|uniref:Uncharacterized protein n=1 Tax=Lentibacillus halophilus TaxID=295065 RepID=A0ABN0Z5U4_9BACI
MDDFRLRPKIVRLSWRSDHDLIILLKYLSISYTFCYNIKLCVFFHIFTFNQKGASV